MLIPLAVEILVVLLLATPANALQRCESYKTEVRVQHERVFGIDFPWWYAVGQLQQESNCRNVISRDGVGSQGVSQVTWRFWEKYLQAQGVPDLGTSTNQIRAQALINKDAYNQAKPKKLWISYQIYNGGGLVLKEIARAGVADWESARCQCKRKIITFSNGQKIDACVINYDYSQLLYKYGNTYRIGNDSPTFNYW